MKSSIEPFLDSSSIIGDGHELWTRLKRDGYLFVRGLLPVSLLEDLRLQILEIAQEAGWVLPSNPLAEARANLGQACVEPQPQFRKVYNRVYHLEAFHALAHNPNLMGLFGQMFNEPVLLLPRIIGRIIFPRDPKKDDMTTPAHQDYPAIQGTPDTFTAWFPLSDCPMKMGCLTVCESSHHHGVYDLRPAFGAGGMEIADSPAGTWRSNDFQAGDVLIFHSMTVHKALANNTDQLRISMDCRYQKVRDPVCSLGFELDGNPLSWPGIYSNWKSKEYQYYWQKWNLHTVPFDRKYYEKRDADAFELASKGDRRVISALQRIVDSDPNPEKRKKAQELLTAFERSEQ